MLNDNLQLFKTNIVLQLVPEQKQLLVHVLQNRCHNNFAKFTGKHPCWSLLLIKLQNWKSATLLKSDSNKNAFLWILGNFKNSFCYRTSLVAAFARIPPYVRSTKCVVAICLSNTKTQSSTLGHMSYSSLLIVSFYLWVFYVPSQSHNLCCYLLIGSS